MIIAFFFWRAINKLLTLVRQNYCMEETTDSAITKRHTAH
jgi:hypothetical protein